MEHKAFDDIRHTVAHDTLQAYSDFNKRFDIHTDTSDYQLRVVTIQNGKPIAFYRRTSTEAQKRYTVTEN